MSRFMPRTLAAALAATLLLASAPAALAADTPTVDVQVETGLEELEGTDAGAFWEKLHEDLTAAIAARLEAQPSEVGANLRVRIDRVALSNAYDMMQTDGVPFLDGRVTVIGPTMSDSRLLRVTAEEDAEGEAPVGPEAKYASLVEGFADGVVAIFD